ncbi:MAG TPA: kelch repeat-containing protein [Candidatus Binataceae bacterium]
MKNRIISLPLPALVVCAAFSLVLGSASLTICQAGTNCIGGPDPNSLDATASAEIYDPITETFAKTGSMTEGRLGHSAELLPSGNVLILGGLAVGHGVTGVARENLYEPGRGVFSNLQRDPGASDSSVPQTVTQFQPGRFLLVEEGSCAASTVFDYPALTNSGLNYPLLSPVAGQSATLLADGNVLIAGGYTAREKCSSQPGLVLDSGIAVQLTDTFRFSPWTGWIVSAAEIYQPSASGFARAGSMRVPRIGHTATLLKNGQVLIAGGFTGNSVTGACELFDPVVRALHSGPTMHEARIGHTATLLADGRVLIAGGFTGTGFSDSAELYNPDTGKFELAGSMNTARESATATLLRDATVLVAGGHNREGITRSCELFDQQNKQFRATAGMIHPRYSHSATLLSNGKVLIAGGGLEITFSSIAGEVFDSTTMRFTGVTSFREITALDWRNWNAAPWARLPDGRVLQVYWGPFSTHYKGPPVVSQIYDAKDARTVSTMPMNVLRREVTVTSLDDGRVLVAGGLEVKANRISSVAEIYDSRTDRFIPTGSMTTSRIEHAAIRLKDGRVLIVGGQGVETGGALASAELYDTATGRFSATGSMARARRGPSVTKLDDGHVLVVGGVDANNARIGTAEVYDSVSGRFSSTGSMMSAISPDIIRTLSSGEILMLGAPQFPPMNCTSP